MVKKQNGFYSGALWLTVSALILKIIGLVYKVPLSYILGDEGMGYFNSAYTVYTLFYIVGTAGIPKSISIIVSKSEAERDRKAYGIYKNAFSALFILGLILLSLFLIFGKPLANAIGNNRSLLSMYAIAPSVLFVCAGGVSRGYLSGCMRFSPIAIAELISGVSKLVLGLLFAYLGTLSSKSLPEICALAILGITVGSFLSFVYLYFTARRTREDGYIKTPFFKTVSSTLKIAVPITLASAASSLVNLLDLSFVMNGLSADISPTVASALYGNYTTLAVPMLTLVSTLLTPISVAVMPSLARLYHSGDESGYNDGVKTAARLTTFIAYPAFFFLAFFPRELLVLIFEEGSAILGFTALAVLSPSVIFLGILTVVNTAHEATGRIGVPVLSMIVGGVVKLAVSISLIKNAAFGILGAPIGTVLSYFTSLLFSIVFLKSRVTRSAAFSGSGVALFSSITACAACLYVRIMIPSVSISRTGGVIYALIYIVIYIVLSIVLSKNTRKLLLNFVKINKKQ